MQKITLGLVLTVLAYLSESEAIGQQFNPNVYDVTQGTIREMPLKPPGTIGSVYLEDDWREGKVSLKETALEGKELTNLPLKLDIKTNTFEINTNLGVKILEGAKVLSFEWLNPKTAQTETFLNCGQYKFQNIRLIGFCKLLLDGKVKFVSRVYLEEIKANYNVALDVGSTDNQLVKKERFYIIKSDELFEVDKKTILDHLADKEELVNRYIKENGLKLRKEEDVQQLLSYYNSI